MDWDLTHLDAYIHRLDPDLGFSIEVLVLRVQSAYRIKELNQRLRTAKKVKFNTLLKAAYEGRPIRR